MFTFIQYIKLVLRVTFNKVIAFLQIKKCNKKDCRIVTYLAKKLEKLYGQTNLCILILGFQFLFLTKSIFFCIVFKMYLSLLLDLFIK